MIQQLLLTALLLSISYDDNNSSGVRAFSAPLNANQYRIQALLMYGPPGRGDPREPPFGMPPPPPPMDDLRRSHPMEDNQRANYRAPNKMNNNDMDGGSISRGLPPSSSNGRDARSDGLIQEVDGTWMGQQLRHPLQMNPPIVIDAQLPEADDAPPSSNDSSQDNNNNNGNNDNPQQPQPPRLDTDGTDNAIDVPVTRAPAEIPLQQRLQSILNQQKMADIDIVGDDGIPVPAIRCLVGAASPVLENLLYGDHREARQSIIPLAGYSHHTIQAFVEYCGSDKLNTSPELWATDSPTDFVQGIIALAKLAHEFQMESLASKCFSFLEDLVQKDLPMACVVFNCAHSTLTEDIQKAALDAILEEPEVALLKNTETNAGGIICLDATNLPKLVGQLKENINQLFLLERLDEWKQANQQKYADATPLCKDLASQLDLSSIDPHYLDVGGTIEQTGLVDRPQIMEAFRKQALLASKCGFVFGDDHPSNLPIRHVIVKGAGDSECNGVYTKENSPGYKHYFVKRDPYTNQTRFIAKAEDGTWGICDTMSCLYKAPATPKELPSVQWVATSNGVRPTPECHFIRG